MVQMVNESFTKLHAQRNKSIPYQLNLQLQHLFVLAIHGRFCPTYIPQRVLFKGASSTTTTSIKEKVFYIYLRILQTC